MKPPRTRVLVTAALLAAAFGAVAGCGDTSTGPTQATHSAPAKRVAAVPAPAGKLVYQDQVGAHTQLFVVGADGRGLHQLPHLAGDPDGPAWSPDGSRIAFAAAPPGHKAGVYVMHADGSKQRQISPRSWNADGASFSPDGKWVVFGRDPNARENGITLVRATGGIVRKITTNPDHGGSAGGQCGCDGNAHFTPDGKHIVFKRSRNDETDSAIFIVGRDGRGLKRLTDWRVSAGQPYVSPDGKRLAYSVYSDDNGTANVFVMDLAGGGHRIQVTHQNSGGGTGLNGWSPDGRYLSTTTDSTIRHSSGQIWIINADGSNPRVLTPNAIDAHNANWGPQRSPR